MLDDKIRRHELSDFLRIRRSRISPAEVGLPAGGRRRTPGLRREEVARLAGVSVTWYTWLEQERAIKVSASVVNNLARVLRLGSTERTELFLLALGHTTLDDAPSHKEKVSAGVQHILDHLDGVGALILGPRWDVLAWNRAARALYADFAALPPAERNLLWLVFTSPAMRSLFVDWPTIARDGVARFRVNYDRHAGEVRFARLIDKLKSVSLEFAQWWSRHDVLPLGEGLVRFNHPAVGQLLLDYVAFTIADNPDLSLVTVTPVTKLDSVTKLRLIIESFKCN
jgi:transcriptional regulator with XRE-family HTH domain